MPILKPSAPKKQKRKRMKEEMDKFEEGSLHSGSRIGGGSEILVSGKKREGPDRRNCRRFEPLSAERFPVSESHRGHLG